ncbi:DUF2537 domain-containing protein [Tsukamurella soli]|uniref:DUF2537 domain-containing protein n=1 Tax=Tsukamurella soli TaxID=644556 RepID=UPI003605B289
MTLPCPARRPRSTPWATGLTVAAMIAAYTAGVGVALFGGCLAVSRWLGVALLLLGSAGAVPLIAQARSRPVARWFAGVPLPGWR